MDMGNTVRLTEFHELGTKAVKADKFEKALRDIQNHIELSIPIGYQMSGVWNIANLALKDEPAVSR